MTRIRGHASPDESHRISVLEEKLGDQTISHDEQLELALLCLEPGHDGFRAAELLQGILAVAPEHDLARLWLAYCCIYELMNEEALREAVKLCDDLAQTRLPSELLAAALLLKGTALRQAGRGDEAFALLCESVRMAPGWISNRQFLAKIYQERGNKGAAEEQLRRALEASHLQPETKNYADQLFEVLITARASYRRTERLQEQLEWLRR